MWKSGSTKPPLDDDNDLSLAWKKSGATFDKGPDQLLPSEAIYTWHIDGATRISQLGKAPYKNQTPISVPTLMMEGTAQHPQDVALAAKRNGDWKKWTYTDYLEEVRTVAKAFIALGLERQHAVCIIGYNSPEWFIADLGAIFAGGIAVGVYTTDGSSSCKYVAENSRCNVFVVQDAKQLDKILKIKDQLPNLKAIVQYEGESSTAGVLSWAQLLALGAEQSDAMLDQRLRQIAINQCCTLIYTSGTTGAPKGVMLSHDNMTWTTQMTRKMTGFGFGCENILSFLPLSHIAAQVVDVYCPICCGATVYFADKFALRGTLVQWLKEVPPTKFVGVPRIWEKFYERINAVSDEAPALKKFILNWARAIGLEYNRKILKGENPKETLSFKLANKLVFSKVREALGMSKCNNFVSAAAPINPIILEYFHSLNIPLAEVYGMSESSGPHSVGLPTAFKIGSSGRPLLGVDMKLRNQDSNGHGEICMGGRHVMMGYIGKPDETRRALDEDGWLHSEDLGKVDEDGYLFVIGRLKELLITAGGENVAPVPIENAIKRVLPIVSQACVIGDKLKYLSVLLTLKCEIDEKRMIPSDKLKPEVTAWFQDRIGRTYETLPEVLRDITDQNSELAKIIEAGINEVNEEAQSQVCKIKKWTILPMDFSLVGGELGPTLKIKRRVVNEKYKNIISHMYK